MSHMCQTNGLFQAEPRLRPLQILSRRADRPACERVGPGHTHVPTPL